MIWSDSLGAFLARQTRINVHSCRPCALKGCVCAVFVVAHLSPQYVTTFIWSWLFFSINFQLPSLLSSLVQIFSLIIFFSPFYRLYRRKKKSELMPQQLFCPLASELKAGLCAQHWGKSSFKGGYFHFICSRSRKRCRTFSSPNTERVF